MLRALSDSWELLKIDGSRMMYFSERLSLWLALQLVDECNLMRFSVFEVDCEGSTSTYSYDTDLPLGQEHRKPTASLYHIVELPSIW